MRSLLTSVETFSAALATFQEEVKGPLAALAGGPEVSELRVLFRALSISLPGVEKVLAEAQGLLRIKQETLVKEEEDYDIVCVDEGGGEEDQDGDKGEEEQEGDRGRQKPEGQGEGDEKESAGPSKGQLSMATNSVVDDMDLDLEEPDSPASEERYSGFVASDRLNKSSSSSDVEESDFESENDGESSSRAKRRKRKNKPVAFGKGTITLRVTEASKFLRNETTETSEKVWRSRLLGLKEKFTSVTSTSKDSQPIRLAGCDWRLRLRVETEKKWCIKSESEERGREWVEQYITTPYVQLTYEADFAFPWRCSLSSVTFHLISKKRTLPDISLRGSTRRVLCDVATAKKYLLKDELELRVDFVVRKLAVNVDLEFPKHRPFQPGLPVLYKRRPGKPGNFLLHWREDAPQPTAVIRDALLLLRSGNHADLTILSKEGEEFKAHRLILAARDEKLFGGENAEFEWMSHLSSHTIERLLTFLYGGMDRKKKERNPELIRFVLPIYIEISKAAQKYKPRKLQELADFISEFCRGGLCSPLTFLESMEILRENIKGQEHADLVLVAGDGGEWNWKAHRLILSMRSPVFSARFSTNGAEDRLEFPELNTQGLRGLLDFFYLGKMRQCGRQSEEDLLPFLDVAEKYELAELKTLIGLQFEGNCSTRNAHRLHFLLENRPGMEAHVEFLKNFIDKCMC